MKKTILLCLCLALVMLFAACGGQPETPETSASTTAAHEHIPTEYSFDVHNHWYVCACGETITEPHNADNFDLCLGCGVASYDNGDGTYTLLTYDEFGSMNSQTDYDAEGNVTFQMIFTTEYYEDGNPKQTWEYHDGVLLYEKLYLPCSDPEYGGVYLSEDITYQDDGKIVMILDENWNILSTTTYDLDGNKVSEETFEYEFDEYGNVLRTACYENGELILLRTAFMGPDGVVYDDCTTYYENGEVTNEIKYIFTFDDNNCRTYQCIMINGVKSDESFYQPDEEGYYYLYHEISYNNGVVVEEYFYTADGEQLLPTDG